MFNWSTYIKTALRGHDPPQAFLPQKNPYAPHRPEDGLDLTRPGSSGLPGEPADPMSSVFNLGIGRPRGISQYEDNTDKNSSPSDLNAADSIPKDFDPDHPFREEGKRNDGTRSEYGGGTDTGHGLSLNDDDSPLGTKQTTLRQLQQTDRDKPRYPGRNVMDAVRKRIRSSIANERK